MATGNNDCSIFIADDDKDDCLLIQKAMLDVGVKNPVQFLEDGQKLLDRLADNLKTPDPNGKPKLPCLILLDLNMPRLDGRETLKRLKKSADLRKIPVVIMTNSKNPEDVENAYKDGATSFLTKPSEFKDLVSIMEQLKIYWFQTVQLPLKPIG
jgi:CheY-like chemotaxis protein